MRYLAKWFVVPKTNKTGRFPKGTFSGTTCETNVTDNLKMTRNTTLIDENSNCLNHGNEYNKNLKYVF